MSKPKSTDGWLRCRVPAAQMRRIKEAAKKKYPEGASLSAFIRAAVYRLADQVLEESRQGQPHGGDG